MAKFSKLRRCFCSKKLKRFCKLEFLEITFAIETFKLNSHQNEMPLCSNTKSNNFSFLIATPELMVGILECLWLYAYRLSEDHLERFFYRMIFNFTKNSKFFISLQENQLYYRLKGENWPRGRYADFFNYHLLLEDPE